MKQQTDVILRVQGYLPALCGRADSEQNRESVQHIRHLLQCPVNRRKNGAYRIDREFSA